MYLFLDRLIEQRINTQAKKCSRQDSYYS